VELAQQVKHDLTMKKTNMAKEVNIDTILDDLSYCGGTGKWDKHYLETVEEIRKDLYELVKEVRVYVIDVPEDTGSDDLTDEEFMTRAEEQGTVYSLKGFQDAFNYEDTVCTEDKYIRII
jgi:hypothetical protein